MVHPCIVVWIRNGYSCKSLLRLVSCQTSLHCAIFHHFALSFLFLFSFFYLLFFTFCLRTFPSLSLSFYVYCMCSAMLYICYVKTPLSCLVSRFVTILVCLFFNNIFQTLLYHFSLCIYFSTFVI